VNILTQTRIGAEGVEMRSWIVPETVKLTPAADWVEQEPAPPDALAEFRQGLPPVVR
jgi:hypothetical protein